MKLDFITRFSYNKKIFNHIILLFF